jgi:hypothetical protein
MGIVDQIYNVVIKYIENGKDDFFDLFNSICLPSAHQGMGHHTHPGLGRLPRRSHYFDGVNVVIGQRVF